MVRVHDVSVGDVPDRERTTVSDAINNGVRTAAALQGILNEVSAENRRNEAFALEKKQFEGRAADAEQKSRSAQASTRSNQEVATLAFDDPSTPEDESAQIKATLSQMESPADQKRYLDQMHKLKRTHAVQQGLQGFLQGTNERISMGAYNEAPDEVPVVQGLMEQAQGIPEKMQKGLLDEDDAASILASIEQRERAARVKAAQGQARLARQAEAIQQADIILQSAQGAPAPARNRAIETRAMIDKGLIAPEDAPMAMQAALYGGNFVPQEVKRPQAAPRTPPVKISRLKADLNRLKDKSPEAIQKVLDEHGITDAQMEEILRGLSARQ